MNWIENKTTLDYESYYRLQNLNLLMIQFGLEAGFVYISEPMHPNARKLASLIGTSLLSECSGGSVIKYAQLQHSSISTNQNAKLICLKLQNLFFKSENFKSALLGPISNIHNFHIWVYRPIRSQDTSLLVFWCLDTNIGKYLVHYWVSISVYFSYDQHLLYYHL